MVPPQGAGSGGPVLELGAGTGRITLGIAQDGIPAHALDADPAMQLRQKLAKQPPEVREPAWWWWLPATCAGKFMAERVRAGKPFWWTFFVGDTTEGGGPDHRTPWYGSPLARQIPASAWGITVPFTLLLLSVLLGIWLMFAPAVLGGTARPPTAII